MAAAADNSTNPTRVWLFYLIFAVTLFIFQEMLLRFVFPVPEIANFNRVNYSILMADEYQVHDEHMKASSYLLIGEEIYKFWKSTGMVNS